MNINNQNDLDNYIKSLKEDLELNNDLDISLEKELKIELLTNQLYNYEEINL
jgi:hypothetical protein